MRASSCGVLVVGGGIAGQAVCEAIRRRDRERAVTLVCGEPHLPYDRVRLGALLEPTGSVGQLRLRPDGWYEDQRIRTMCGVRVQSLDPDAGVAGLDDGTAISFDRVVLCTGSDALVPPFGCSDASGVHIFRDPADCEAILEAAGPGRRAAVIGGGLLGLEAAYSLARLGCQTTLVHLVDRLMERQLDGAAAAMLAPAIEELGIEVRLQQVTTDVVVDGGGHARGLRFSDSTMLDCELVVVAVGIRPHVGLARAVGLAVNRGVVVDDHEVVRSCAVRG